MSMIWHFSKPVVLREVGRNIFVMVFANHADKQRVEGGRPWFFYGQLFFINPFDGFIPVQDMKFDLASFWVQFHNLPLLGMNKECGEKLGSTIGMVEEVEVDEDVGWGSSLRVKILLDLKKPLARGRTITMHGVKIWSPLQYEKLPQFCFTCGRIIHENASCQLEKNLSPQFGAWLRAEPNTRRRWEYNKDSSSQRTKRTEVEMGPEHGGQRGRIEAWWC